MGFKINLMQVIQEILNIFLFENSFMSNYILDILTFSNYFHRRAFYCFYHINKTKIKKWTCEYFCYTYVTRD